MSLVLNSHSKIPWFWDKKEVVLQFCRSMSEAPPDGDSSVMTRFELWISHCRGDSSQVNRWLSFAAQPHLKELNVNKSGMSSVSGLYCLPQVALNLTSLTILNLKCLKLVVDISHVNLPSLKSMSLKYVDVESKVLHNLILGCPSLENFFIKEEHFIFWSNLQISSSRLKFLHIDGGWERIQVEAINLESFVYIGYGDLYDYDFASCKQLTHLSMTGAHFDCAEEFKNIISGFPLLESLTMIDCDLVDIRHQYLKVLVSEIYEDWAGQVKTEISIDAPNLVPFGYHGCHALLQIAVNSPNLLEANITLNFFRNVHSMEWYVNTLNFLSCVDSSKSMSFSLHSEQALIFPENLRKLIGSSPLPNLKHLKVKRSCELERESNLEKALRWLSPSLETLSIEHKKSKLN